MYNRGIKKAVHLVQFTASLLENLDKESITMTQANAQPQTLTIDLNQAHINAGLDKRDLEYLEAAPLMPKRPPLSFRGVSIE